MKKTLSALSLIFISINAFASLDECTSAGLAKDYNAVIKYCKPYINTNKDALSVLTGAYAQLDRGIEAQKYGQLYIDKYSKDTDKESLGLAYLGVGNYYYFGKDGAKKDIQKGLQYITKGAELGNTTAQEQLGNFYLVEGEYPSQNMAISYKWFEIASINGSQEAEQSYILTHLDDMKAQAGYCLAMGEQLVAQSYIDGNDGLLVDTSKAKKYLNDAIALYKDKKPTKEILEHCPAQKGLDLANAEKLLASL
ncbi:hypothetical protein [Francisella philomiragia]|uniref:hypothetical protein n=1 Tax=Francisella philomiragia TaxID=28110 RepID=UPI001C9DE791|nr:hypothetical protein [Francisella philomiragia]MBY7735077.1 hypothetical protein [Francisella philomiragia]